MDMNYRITSQNNKTHGIKFPQLGMNNLNFNYLLTLALTIYQKEEMKLGTNTLVN